ncbi:MAG TPA: hypothetical protein VFV95_20205 [Vicinamibacterales bacterium]|nr:hypothetical protein [Vicinamibacterales bacterium]
MRTWLFLLAVVTLAHDAAPAFAAEPAALVSARRLYNTAEYDAAIDAAAEARRAPDWADAAAVVQGRAYLERYRLRSDPADLAAGGEALHFARSWRLAPRDGIDQLVGVGQWLYLSDWFGAAADLFDNALTQSVLLTARERLQLLDWWATAVDRAAQSRPADRRAPAYARLLARMEDEIRRDPSSPVANYWLPVSARGVGDLDRAWEASGAGWARSVLSSETWFPVREDLDRFVTYVLVVERSRSRNGLEQPEAMRAMLEDWEELKQQWK